MARNTEFYNQAEHTVIYNGVPITDFADGDGVIAVTPNGDRIALTEGLDKSSISFSSFRGGDITIQLKPTSPELDILMEDFQNQQDGTPTASTISIETGVREVVTLANAGINMMDLPTGGPTMQPRTITFRGANLRMRPS